MPRLASVSARIGVLATLVLFPLALPGLVTGCGGHLAADLTSSDGGPEQDGGPSPTATATSSSPSSTSTSPPPPPPPTGMVDAGPPETDAEPPPDTGACLVSLEPCITSAQCCSGFCNASFVCGPSSTPSCRPDGYGCQGAAQCCSGICGGGVCGGVVVDAGPPACYPDGFGCNFPTDCCTGFCSSGTCGYLYDAGPPPACLPDSYACQSYTQCCSGICAYGTCGQPFVDASPPPLCAPNNANACTSCLSATCCAQLGACESDSNCLQALACFNGCFVPGSGNAGNCDAKCGQAYPSAAGTSLAQCAASACGSACN